MGNIFDYLKWRDIELEKVEFNQIDALILSRFSYLPFDGLIEANEKITINECYERYEIVGEKGEILIEADVDLFPALAKSKRFGNLYISDFVNHLDKKIDLQFSAITVHLPNKKMAVLFRGTDNTLVGWKEDFNMSFSTSVPAQIEAVKYLEYVYSKYKKNMIVLGHSKGGNLSIYSSVFCNKKTKKNILDVYNFDGPGFMDEIIDSEEYGEIVAKIHNIIPESSIIGRLLKHKGELTIVKSTEKGIMQHDLYSWQLLGDKFIKAEITSSSEFVDKTLTEWLENVSPEERKNFVDIIFEIFETTGATRLSELSQNKLTTAKTIIERYQKLDAKSKKYVNTAMNMFVKSGKDTIPLMKKENKK